MSAVIQRSTVSANTWNSLKVGQRRRVLSEAGYNPNAYANRAFDFLPSWVKEDADYVIRRLGSSLMPNGMNPT